MSENVELHGGPRHGVKYHVPLDATKRIEMEVTFNVDGVRMSRRCEYTRVHDISGKAEPNFEWVGYTSQFVPVSGNESTGDQHD